MKIQTKLLTPLQIEHRKFSATIIINDNKVRKDENAPLALLLVYERKKKQIALKLYCTPAFFDKRAQHDIATML
jgi:hypothetical protein